MKDFICKKCGNTTYIVQEKSNGTGVATGLYCAKCGTWHKWLNKQEKVLYSMREKSNKDKVLTRLIAENERLKEEVNRLSHKNDELVKEVCNEIKNKLGSIEDILINLGNGKEDALTYFMYIINKTQEVFAERGIDNVCRLEQNR